MKTWADVYAQLGITPADRRALVTIAREGDRAMCSIAHASDLIENERYTSDRHVRAMQEAVTLGEQGKPINLAHVLRWHGFIMPAGGFFRTTTAMISGARHEPPPPPRAGFGQDVNRWVAAVMTLIDFPPRDAAARWYQIARLHLEFEQLHPFPDGNGRVGRVLINYMAAALGLPPVKLGPGNRDAYLDAMNAGNAVALGAMFAANTAGGPSC